ncbi:tetratricopeptide repeat protein [Balneolales bacterium ANBcel1]|nr:tetratricopeptide repeat protein [Balneolales bacterium ANBcel1]
MNVPQPDSRRPADTSSVVSDNGIVSGSTSLRLPGYLLAVILIAASLFIPPGLQAQNPDEYALGNRLLNAGEYEEAYEVFKQLLEDNPRSYAVYDRAVSALVSLQRYDEALEITQRRLDRYSSDINTRVRFGEILHYADRSEEAYAAWQSVLDDHAENLHAYRRVASILNERREYERAIDVYEQARQQLGEPSLFTHEIASNHLSVRNFEEAMREYLDLLGNDPSSMSRIQRQLLNYDERALYDTAIMLAGERAERQSPGSEPDVAYRNFLVWLNMERGLYRRAYAAAQALERRGENEQHILFQTGRRLRTQQQFEWAEQAFTYYLDLENHPLQARSFEELSSTYRAWADHLIDTNRDFGGAADSLYRKAFDTIERLTERFPRYDRIIQTLMMQAELALDHLKDPERAETYHAKMEQIARTSDEKAAMAYVEGRILLFRGEFSLARVALTRSTRIGGSGNLSEKSRYYLGLGDFYNGDFTYARLQLRSLERENHSFFANNALRLRHMIQTAYVENDPGQDMHRELRRYSEARYRYDTGDYTGAASLLAPAMGEPSSAPVHGESILLLTRSLRQIHPETAFLVIDRHTRRPSSRQNPGERLLWERARLAELLFEQRERSDGELASSGGIPPEELLETLFGSEIPLFDGTGLATATLSPDTLVDYYEELLMHYPDGYFADFARERIRRLEQDALS